MNKSENIIENRNKALYDFFNKIFPGKIRLLILNESAPSVIYDNVKCLSCHMSDFELKFTDSTDKKNIIYSIDLNSKYTYDIKKILFWFNDCRHWNVIKIRLFLSKPELYLSGYNFLDKENKKGKYPVFSHHNPKLYFNQYKADEIIASLREEGYTTVSC